MQIIYCDACGLRISEADLKSGGAFQDEASQRNYCPKCAASMHAPKTPAKPPTREMPAQPRTTRTLPAQTRTTPPAQTRTTQPRKAGPPWAIIGLGCGVLGLFLALLGLSGKKQPPVSTPETVQITPEVKPDASKNSARPAEPVTKPVEVSPGTTPEPPAKITSTIVKPADNSMDDIREGAARRRWAELKTAADRGGPGAISVRRQIKDFAGTYSSTGPGKEAAEFYKALIANDPPPPGTNIFANYKRDFKSPQPGPGWRYFWNPNGAIGESSKYVPLLWGNKDRYCTDVNNFPAHPPAAYASLWSEGGHPGVGVHQRVPADRFAIAAYTLQTGQGGKVALAVKIARPDVEHQGNVELKIFVGDSQKTSVLIGPGSTGTEFNMELGTLKEGDTVYVGVGPAGEDYGDSFNLDFTIYPIP